ncbi:MAG: GldG family protein [Deltaproteobacteria bacterium]|nr:GldG family protein [Deltaproteobacteria bacterium]
MSGPATLANAPRVLARVFLVVGAVVFGTASTLGLLLFGASSWLARLPLAVGALLLVAGALLRRREPGTAPARLRAVLVLGVALGAAALVQVAAARLDVSWDVTTSRRNTLAEASIATARALDREVLITAYLEGHDRAAVELEQLVASFARHTDLLRLVRVAPSDDPEAARAAGASVVVRAGERVRKLRFDAGAPDHEAALVSALRAVTTDAPARVYFTSGHGELELRDESARGMSRLRAALLDEGLEPVPLPLAVAGRVPDDARAVVVAAPRTTLSAAELELVRAYLDAGGRLLVLCEPGDDGGLGGLLGGVGVQLVDDVVLDGSAFASVFGGPEMATGVAYAAHPVTRRLGSAMTHFSRARSLAENPGTLATTAALVQSGAEAWGEIGPVTAEARRDDVDVAGPVTLALAAEQGATRVLVVGDATFATNLGLGLGANRDLALNAVLWLAEREQQIAVRARGRGGNLLLLTPSARERVAFLLLYGLPALLVALGLAVHAVRRAR